MTIKSVRAIILSILTASICSSAIAQVTIGSTEAPMSGALLDLKEEDQTQRGLGLPRVNLISNKSLEPCITTPADTELKQAHIGLIVYNVGVEIETNEEDRICKGLHVWNGEKWEPVIAYPDFTNLLAGPRADLIDKRGPNEQEVNTYNTAYFYSFKGNRYTCDASKVTAIDAGQWMTVNLNTRYFASNTSYKGEPIFDWDTHKDRHTLAVAGFPSNTGLVTPNDDEQIRLNGLFYNWMASTGFKDKDREAGSEYKGSMATLEHPRVQGICPEGWHLPTYNEWRTLLEAVKAQPYLYNIDGATSTEISSTMRAQSDGGKSKLPQDGGMSMIATGTAFTPTGRQEYGTTAYFWTSTSATTGKDNNGNYTNGRAFNIDLKGNLIPTSPLVTLSYRSRVLMEAIRCKKN